MAHSSSRWGGWDIKSSKQFPLKVSLNMNYCGNIHSLMVYFYSYVVRHSPLKSTPPTTTVCDYGPSIIYVR